MRPLLLLRPLHYSTCTHLKLIPQSRFRSLTLEIATAWRSSSSTLGTSGRSSHLVFLSGDSGIFALSDHSLLYRSSVVTPVRQLIAFSKVLVK